MFLRARDVLVNATANPFRGKDAAPQRRGHSSFRGCLPHWHHRIRVSAKLAAGAPEPLPYGPQVERLRSVGQEPKLLRHEGVADFAVFAVGKHDGEFLVQPVVDQVLRRRLEQFAELHAPALRYRLVH
mmetsp:Transcript_16065/g.36664  ORF Transcript_16065/g.36664 Transcript_16065/m.36664 type:complete len:128 (-) Transcript_16065:39-422(-)